MFLFQAKKQIKKDVKKKTFAKGTKKGSKIVVAVPKSNSKSELTISKPEKDEVSFDLIELSQESQLSQETNVSSQSSSSSANNRY